MLPYGRFDLNATTPVSTVSVDWIFEAKLSCRDLGQLMHEGLFQRSISDHIVHHLGRFDYDPQRVNTPAKYGAKIQRDWSIAEIPEEDEVLSRTTKSNWTGTLSLFTRSLKGVSNFRLANLSGPANVISVIAAARAARPMSSANGLGGGNGNSTSGFKNFREVYRFVADPSRPYSVRINCVLSEDEIDNDKTSRAKWWFWPAATGLSNPGGRLEENTEEQEATVVGKVKTDESASEWDDWAFSSMSEGD